MREKICSKCCCQCADIDLGWHTQPSQDEHMMRPGEHWTGPKVLGLWSFSPPELSQSNAHSWIQAKQASVTLARRRLKSRQDCFQSSMIMFVDGALGVGWQIVDTKSWSLALWLPHLPYKHPHPSVGHQLQLDSQHFCGIIAIADVLQPHTKEHT